MDALALDALRAEFGDRVQFGVPLGASTTYRVGGHCAARLFVGSVDDLIALGQIIGRHNVSVVTLGKGSNLLVAESGFDGVVISLDDTLSGVSIDGVTVQAGGGAPLPVVARRTAAGGLTGFEWAVGVPGSIGGGVRMNAGGHGSDMAASLVSVHLVDLLTGTESHRSLEELGLGFRTSSLKRTDVVVSAELKLIVGDRAIAEAEIAEIVKWRRENQPGGANAGSVFTNPRPESAGRLIDEAGAKSLREGSAYVSSKHANFIQVDDGGSADDVVKLMATIHALVVERCGVDLRAETHLLGFTSQQAIAAGALLLDAEHDANGGVA